MSTSAPGKAAASSARRGRVLLLVSAVAFSAAGFFAREAPVDPWAMVVWRNTFGSTAMLLYMLADRNRGRLSIPLRPQVWAAIALSSFGMVCYVAAFAYTAVADIAIIYATAPLVMAGAAWLFLREGPARRTVAAALLAFVGAGITIGGSLRGGTILGDGLALAMTLALSIVAVLARSAPLPALPTAFVSSLLAAVVALPLGWMAGADLGIAWRDAAWLAAFGIVSMGIALPCYLSGAQAVPAGEAMLISASELPLAPLWVWVAFGEVPTRATLWGGLLVGAAISVDLAMAARQGSRRRRPD